MRRVILIAATGLSLAGCSSFPSLDVFKSTPPTVLVRLESVPSGADARTSLGPGCRTPCSVSVTPPEGSFSVNYSLPRFQPATASVQVLRTGGELFSSPTITIDPNPVTMALQPDAPPPRARKKIMRPKKRRPPAAADAPAAAGSPFPDPAAPQPTR